MSESAFTPSQSDFKEKRVNQWTFVFSEYVQKNHRGSDKIINLYDNLEWSIILQVLSKKHEYVVHNDFAGDPNVL